MEFMLKSEAGLDVVQTLINRAIADFEADGCTAVCFLVSPGSRKVSQLKQCGFWEVAGIFNRIPPPILQKHAAHQCDIILKSLGALRN